ncbi:MAG: hypothetical protein A2Y67_00165 [Candidatus Buchananbacteria bacterium RBG_13_39_9]|uniref:Urease accessory protein UreH-like transmembrane domain-containing protein n=1 Tax=Candidatus Buchananbacteria bacterium RBG_13_39_9 TaxID=1797531 RepID=A0A1G1XR85_9BACT|nr:MAG: hypothetical protein A2Y67_00165 [Candidatus Buchananbacteria bacterium RBG_13_39_9]
MINKFKISFLVILGSLFMAKTSLAVCPVCTVAVGAGVGLSRWLGVDDLITGTWIGGLLVSMIWWTIGWLNKKNIRFKGRKILAALAYYLLVILPLYFSGVIGHPYNQFCGLDKLLFGIIIGSIGFFAGAILNLWLKKKNQGKVYFPFQKVVLPVGILIIISVVLYIILKC